MTINEDWKQHLKEHGIKYFVLKGEDWMNALSADELYIFNEMLEAYNTYREPKPINKYLVLNIDEYTISGYEELKEIFKNYERK